MLFGKKILQKTCAKNRIFLNVVLCSRTRHNYVVKLLNRRIFSGRASIGLILKLNFDHHEPPESAIAAPNEMEVYITDGRVRRLVML